MRSERGSGSCNFANDKMWFTLRYTSENIKFIAFTCRLFTLVSIKTLAKIWQIHQECKSYALCIIIVYAHGRRLCSNWVRHGSTTISYQQCSLTFMRERYLHRSFAYAKRAVCIDVVSVHKLFAYRVVSTVSTDIVSSHTKYCRIANDIAR